MMSGATYAQTAIQRPRSITAAGQRINVSGTGGTAIQRADSAGTVLNRERPPARTARAHDSQTDTLPSGQGNFAQPSPFAVTLPGMCPVTS